MDAADASIRQRQRLEEERKARIFDAKTRTIGVDKQALDDQVEEHKKLEELERARDAFYNNEAIKQDEHALFLAAQEESLRAQDATDVERYRKQFQQSHARREWDLNDPNALQKDLPGRVGDNDPRCGISSMQKFHGEDLDAAERRRKQAEQMKEWTKQQLAEKAYLQWAEKENDRKHAEYLDAINKKAHMAQALVTDSRNGQAKATADFNRAMAAQRKQELENERSQNQASNLEEIRNALDSDLLTENVASTLNVNDPYRFKRSHMKGLMPEHRQAILNEQAAQRDAMKARRFKEAEDDRQWALAASKTNAMATRAEELQQEARARAVNQLNQERQQQASEAAARRQRLTDDYQNDVGEEYFARFNSTTR